MGGLIRVSTKFGLIGGAVLTFIFLVYYFTDSNPLVEMGFIDFFILPIFLYFGIRDYRDTHNDGFLEFWQGMTSGFIIYFLLALLSSGFMYLFMEYADTSLAEAYIHEKIQDLSESKNTIIQKMGQDAYDKMVTEAGGTNAFYLGLDNFLRKMGIGLMLTSAISVIMKRKKKN